MTTQQIATRLVELCRTGQNTKAQEELYHPEEIVSIEPASSVKGMAAIKEKAKQFQSVIKEIHSVTVSDPIIQGNFFSLAMTMDVTYQDGNRQNLAEICVYQVKAGKVVKEQFFYD
jgi:hypothetical protein